MSVCNTFTVYIITRKILEQSASIFVGTLRTLGQHEFAPGFCGSIGVEISRMKSLVAGDPCSSITLVRNVVFVQLSKMLSIKNNTVFY